jgi:hypothetical protein
VSHTAPEEKTAAFDLLDAADIHKDLKVPMLIPRADQEMEAGQEEAVRSKHGKIPAVEF